MELKSLKNNSSQPEWVVWKGKQIVIPPQEQYDVDVDVAKLFFEKYGEDGVIEEMLSEDIGKVYDTAPNRDVWVANVTGDLDAPDKIKVKRSEKGRWFEMEVENPLKKPYEVRRTMKGGMKEVIGKSGLEALNLLPTVIRVPPYRRVRLQPHVAKWFLQRVAMSGVRDCIKSRGPADFEPSSKWSIRELRVYLSLIDPTLNNYQLGSHEYKIRKNAQHGKPGTEGRAKNVAKAIREAKEALLKRIFRRIFDPKFRLPTKAEFDAMLGATEPDPVDPEDKAPPALPPEPTLDGPELSASA